MNMVHSPSGALKMMLALAISVLMSQSARAEISPREYRRMQREAPEFVKIEVLKVRTTPVAERRHERAIEGRAFEVFVEAKVVHIHRSHERIHTGEVIHIAYVTHQRERNVPGPGEPPVLERGKIYPAFLHKVEGERRAFAPAAGAFSFDPLEDIRR